MSDERTTINIHGGQMIVAKNQSTVTVTQNNGMDVNELENIINGIKENLSGLKKEDAENIKDTIELAKDELVKPEPKVSRLRNCVTLMAPMFTIANGLPILANNLQKLVDYITLYIK